jgi:group I intron endonuclease
MYCVYLITNLMNDKTYVGRSKHFDRRVIEHLTLLRKGTHYNKKLQHSFNKYGEECFSFSKLFESDFEMDCIALEQSEIDSGRHWYNLSSNSSGGGVKSPNLKNREHSLEKLINALVFFINNNGDLPLTCNTFGISKSYLWNVIKGKARKYEDFGTLREDASSKIKKVGHNSGRAGKRTNLQSFRRKLSSYEVLSLFEMYCSSPYSCKSIGQSFGITETAVRSLLKRETYREVDIPESLSIAALAKMKSRCPIKQTHY